MLNLAKNENAENAKFSIPLNLVIFKVVLSFVPQYFTPSHLQSSHCLSQIPQLTSYFIKESHIPMLYTTLMMVTVANVKTCNLFLAYVALNKSIAHLLSSAITSKLLKSLKFKYQPLYHCTYNAEKKGRIQVFDEVVKFADRKHICYHTIPLPVSYCKHDLYTCCYHIVTALLDFLLYCSTGS